MNCTSIRGDKMQRPYKIQCYTSFKFQTPKMKFFQNDTESCKISFEMYEDVDAPLTGIISASCSVDRPDAKTYTYGSNAFVITDNIAILTLPQTAVGIPGDYEFTISMYGDSFERVTFGVFKYTIQGELIADQPIDTFGEYPILTGLIAQVTQASIDEPLRVSAEEARVVAEQNRVTAEVLRENTTEEIKLAYDNATKANLSVEVSNSRGTFETLDGRLDASDSSLADSTKLQNANILNVNVKYLGAKGNANYFNTGDSKWYEDSSFNIESQDDTPYFKEAIKQVQLGGRLYVPKGNYLISLNVTWSGDDPLFPWWGTGEEKSFIIEGVGDGSKLIANGDYALKIEYTIIQAVARKKTVRLKDLCIDCAGHLYGAYFTNCGYVVVENCTILNNKKALVGDDFKTSSGLYFTSCGEYAVIGRNVIKPLSGCSIYGAANSSDSLIKNTSIVGGEVGIFLKNTGATFISGNCIYGQTIACIKTVNTTGAYGSNNISNNELEATSGDCISINDDVENVDVARNINISNNFFFNGNHNTNGIVMGKSQSEQVHGNFFANITTGFANGKSAFLLKNSRNGLYTNNIIEKLEDGSVGFKVLYGFMLTIDSNIIQTVASTGAIKFIEITDGSNIRIGNNLNHAGNSLTHFIHALKTIPAISIIANYNPSTSLITVPYDTWYTWLDNKKVHNQSGFQIEGGLWNDCPLRLGNCYLWIDATNDLRIKSSAPANDLDGMVVGTQS